jgi:hypothetical protein
MPLCTGRAYVDIALHCARCADLSRHQVKVRVSTTDGKQPKLSSPNHQPPVESLQEESGGRHEKAKLKTPTASAHASHPLPSNGKLWAKRVATTGAPISHEVTAAMRRGPIASCCASAASFFSYLFGWPPTQGNSSKNHSVETGAHALCCTPAVRSCTLA